MKGHDDQSLLGNIHLELDPTQDNSMERVNNHHNEKKREETKRWK